MPSIIIYGNMQSYKTYILPKAKKLFGSYSFRRKSTIKHHKNVQKMLEILALNGPLTTWGMAKVDYQNDISGIRTKEKDYRRLLKGRKDRGKHSPGVLDVGLVVVDGKNYERGPSDIYRLSLHGILYCLDVLDLTNKEIDVMASKYSDVLPWLFGRWNHIKSVIGNDVYRLKTLAGGIFVDNIQVTKMTKFPVFELLTYLSIKYQNNFESIKENDLSDQISCWFYTHLLLPTGMKADTGSTSAVKKIMDGDKPLKKWYDTFLNEAIKFYDNRFQTIKKMERI
ncbi:hypothetical protein [Candidatus Nitrosotenuis cloacae]|uniref:hypothetical protein n=1 Tax=Candidatus Nitrosotenuis cloacae TaxID=1603555 RepID=UPI00227ECA3E|nr:hypothetical protein [Candidatus Nitrosotenuis cloacae]